MDMVIDKRRFYEIANVYIKDGVLLKYRFLSDDQDNPDYLLGRLKLPVELSSLDSVHVTRIMELKDRVIMDYDSQIVLQGFDDKSIKSIIAELESR